MKKSIIRVGTIEGRHPLPVDEYIINKTDGSIVPGQSAYDLALEKTISFIQNKPRNSIFKVFYTGLTEVTIGVLDGFYIEGINPLVYRYDREKNEYVELVRRIRIP